MRMETALKEHLEDLVCQAQTGNVEAFGRVFDELHPFIYRYIVSKSSPDVAEDLTEETFFKAWQSLNKYRKKKNCFFSSWIFRIAHNLVVDYYRQNQEIEELTIDLADANIQNTAKRETEIYFNQKLAQSLIGKLSKTLQQAVRLRFINDLSYPEIARTMDKTEGAVRVMIHRAIEQLRILLKEEENKNKSS